MTVGIKGIRGSFAELEGNLDSFIQEHQELIDTIKENEIEINRLHLIISELKAQLDKGDSEMDNDKGNDTKVFIKCSSGGTNTSRCIELIAKTESNGSLSVVLSKAEIEATISALIKICDEIQE